MRVSKKKQRFLDTFLLYEKNAFDVFEKWLLPEKIVKSCLQSDISVSFIVLKILTFWKTRKLI